MEQCWLMLILDVQTASCFHGNITSSSCRYLHLSVPGTQREFKIPFPGFQLFFSGSGRTPAAEKGPSIRRAAGDSSKRLSIQTSKNKGSGTASFSKLFLPSGGMTQWGSLLDKEAREHIHFPLLGTLLLSSSDC